MIAQLEGKITAKLERTIILSCGAVGYEVGLAGPYFDTCKIGNNLSLFIHTHVRETEISLYGFKTIEEMKLFRQMINISGIGPRLAMDFLAKPQEELKSAIASEDINFITSIPGVGKKTAQRLILELKNKIDLEGVAINTTRQHQDIDNEAFISLQNLGYQTKEIKSILQLLPSEITKTEDVIRYFLQNI